MPVDVSRKLRNQFSAPEAGYGAVFFAVRMDGLIALHLQVQVL